MRRLNMVILALALLGSAVPAVRGQPPDSATESLSAWQWYHEVQIPEGEPALADFLLTPSVFDRAQPTLHDLRLYNARGREMPFSLRIRRRQNEQRPLKANVFNRAINPDRSAEISLDLGEARVEHNLIEVATTGREFRRALRVESSDDEMKWSTLLEGKHLLHFEDVQGPKVDVRKFHYTPSRFRYLRVRVSPYAGVADDAPAITAATVYHSVQTPGEFVTQPANLQAREPVPGDGGPGSAWLITFGNNELAPCESLTFNVGDDEFVRPYRLEIANPGEPRQIIAQGELRRRTRDKHKPLVISFQEVTARRLRLVVTDYRNPPLHLTGVQYTAPARQIIFEPPADTDEALKLYFGNPKAQEPGYDFASNLPKTIDPPPVRTTLGNADAEPQQNPKYVIPPKPWSERWPWGVYVVLGATSLVLLGVLGALGREAIARHDAAETT